jgi:hypothetical protein
LSHGLGRLGAGRWRLGKKPAGGIAAKLMCQLVQAADRVTEACGDLRGRQLLDEIGPQGFILPMGGIRGGEKDLSQIH